MGMNLEVCLLGRFEITLDGASILPALGNSKKKIALLQYLLVNMGEGYTNADLFEHLWGDDDGGNPASGLNTLVSRLRKDLKAAGLSDILASEGGVYRWNAAAYPSIDVYRFRALAEVLLDVEQLDDGAAAVYAADAAGGDAADPDGAAVKPDSAADPDGAATVREQFEAAFAMYRGDLLLGYDTEAWIVPKSMEYHRLYVRLAHRYLSLLTAAGDYEDALRIARQALEIDQFDSRLNMELMNAMLALGMKTEAINHYNYTVNLHSPQPGMNASADLLEFYRAQLEVEQDSESILETVSRDLARDDGDNTALVCDYVIFRDVYKINMRNLQRLGVPIFLGVLTLSRKGNTQTDSEAILLDRIMGMLQATLKFNLRKGDTISRYGPSQFVVLLPTQNHSTGSLALERVRNAFYSNCSIPDFVLSYKLTPVGYSKTQVK